MPIWLAIVLIVAVFVLGLRLGATNRLLTEKLATRSVRNQPPL